MIDKEKIKNKVSVTDIFKHFGVEISADNRAVCPFHDDHDPSITIKDDKIWTCWVCNDGGDVIKFVMMKLNLDFVAAVRWFENFLGYSKNKVVSLKKKEDHDLNKKCSFYFDQIENKIIKELKSKDIHPKTIHLTYYELDSYAADPKNYKDFEIYKKELFSLYKKVKEL